MKRIILFFAVCLGLSASQTTFADDAELARAASKRTSTTVSTNQSANRTITASTKRADSTQNTSKNARTATKPQQRVVSRTATTQQNIKPRETTNVKIAPSTQQKRVSTVSRVASSRNVNSRNIESILKSTVAGSARSATSAKNQKRNVRAAELNSEKITNIKSLNYSKCKTVYYECMDEFCANKDTNLRRCACSSRIHEFDGIKKQLADAEDKMLDFNQRLLTVSMDKEDAAAINVATEGELAFEKKDTSESEKLLQKITKTLNNSGDSKLNNDLSSISLSLDMDTAWDSVDSMGGIATSAKTGLDLYNAAQPICIEMAREVCSDDELGIAQDGYKLTIQQDCNTVAKSYDTLYNNAMEKIHESGALLDMSRLNVYQQRNSDDTLTCKKKILEQLSNTAVCGENLYKCLDTTGQYIDPSNGAAFLSKDLYNLTTLLQEPGADEQWSKIDKNEKFVNFLNSKKEFLEPAIEQCQDISDMVWKDFLDDALAQIKLAQNAKLEEVRRSCTTLVAECKTNALTSLSDFDARALSSFSVVADKTVNEMCSDIQESCISLMNTNTYPNDWADGITGIATNVSYKNIIETCTNVGRDCIVQQCNGTSGNFALCQKATDDNRRAILTRNACWDKVLDCVKKADNLDNMKITDLYPTSTSDGYWAKENSATDVCEGTACYIAKQIWGNCEYKSDKYAIANVSGNGIKESNKIDTSASSLLSWFASNTNTSDNADSCNSNGCEIGFQFDTNTNSCKQLFGGKTTCEGEPSVLSDFIMNVTGTFTNYCTTNTTDSYGNCCVDGHKDNGICVPDTKYKAIRFQNLTCTTNTAEGKNNNTYLCPKSGNMILYCITTTTSSPIDYYQTTAEYSCNNGFWLIVDSDGTYINPDKNHNTKPHMYYKTAAGSNSTCEYSYEDNAWTWAGECTQKTSGECSVNSTDITSNSELFIKYN